MPSRIEFPHAATTLLVDDSALQRSYGRSLCRELGIGLVYEASNGQEALALLESLQPPPDLIIIDLEMPTMDGPELLEQLGRRHVITPIIIASSRELSLVHSVQDMGAAMGLNILAALQKPLQLESLRAALRNYGAAAIAQQQPAHQPVDAEALRAGIERGEITVHYHPQIDIHTGEVRGVEALARWQHPTLGLILPDQFIPLAEQHGLIHGLTMQVMNQAMMQTSIWNSSGLDLTVAINLSPLLLNNTDLLGEIAGLQQCHALVADRIVLEITETSLVRELGVALSVLTRLRLRGFGLSLDDYGTGFSSMQQLARIPFTELKIDRSFVHGAHERQSLQVILRSALELARQLGLATVAEGVETIADWRLLQQFGCTLGQGWLIARPMPVQEFTAWFKAHRAHQQDYCRAAAAG